MSPRHPGSRPGYLCVDDFLATLVGARALSTAFELGLVDLLIAGGEVAVEAARVRLALAPRPFRLLLDLLKANGVIELRGDRLSLSGGFEQALGYRDLLEAKLDFAAVALPDFSESFTTMLSRPEAFMQRSGMFDLFRYDRCFESSPENLDNTRRWMRLTTALTRYESSPCLEHFDFSPYRRALDVGGNSGEFMLRVLAAHPRLRATVVDLPVVCAIGREHVAAHPQSDRIEFVSGDARRDPLPGGHDLVSFKSMLHDWPEEDALDLLRKAADVLQPGGTLLVFERGVFEIGDRVPPYSMLPHLLFAGYYRSPAVYARHLESLGLRAVDVIPVDLEMRFHIVTARKPG